MNKLYCELCKIYVPKSSLWKQNKSDKHTNIQRYEQTDNFDDIVEIPEWFFREKRVRGFVDTYHLKLPLSNQYYVILIHHDPIDLHSELKLVGKYNQYIAQVHINNIVIQMAIKYGELINQFIFKIEVYANVRYEKYPEDEPAEILDQHIPVETITNITEIQLNDLDITTNLDNEM